MSRMKILLLVPVLALALCACGAGGSDSTGLASAPPGGGGATPPPGGGGTTPPPGGGGTPPPGGGGTPPPPNQTDTTPPTTPTGLTATVANSIDVNVSWNPSTDNVGVTSYQIRRGGTVVGTSTTTSFRDAGLPGSTSFSYTVAARDAAGNTSANSASASATTGNAPPPPPVPGPLPNTALGNLAASMAPGTWAQLTAQNQNATLGVGGVTGSMIPFCNTMPWNPHSKVIEFVGEDHNWGSLRHVRYDVATNTFVLVAADAGLGNGPSHAYDHNVVNPFTGDLYHRKYSGPFSGSISSARKALGASSFVNLPNVSANEQVALGATWWSGTFVGGGNQGAFMIFNSGATDGQIVAYNPLSNTWFYNQLGKAPNFDSGRTGDTYHSVMEYSSQKNVAVYGGGNAAPNRLWRLNSDGSFLAMPNAPNSVGVNAGILVNEPVTGNFLLLSSGELWELDPSGSGTWTQKTTPPSGVGVPGQQNMCGSSISDYGVVAFIKQPNSSGATFFIYKHQ